MIIGFIYYMPGVFGASWMKLGKIDEKRFHKEQPMILPLIFLAALVTAFVMAHFMYLEHAFFHDSWISAGLSTAVWTFLGFAFTTVYIHHSLDQRPANLTL